MPDWKDNYTDLVEHSYTKLEEKTIEHRSWSEETKQRVKQAHAAGMSVAEYFGEAVRKAKRKYDQSNGGSRNKTVKVVKRKKRLTLGDLKNATHAGAASAVKPKNDIRNIGKALTKAPKGSSLKSARKVTERTKDASNTYKRASSSVKNNAKKAARSTSGIISGSKKAARSTSGIVSGNKKAGRYITDQAKQNAKRKATSELKGRLIKTKATEEATIRDQAEAIVRRKNILKNIDKWAESTRKTNVGRDVAKARSKNIRKKLKEGDKRTAKNFKSATKNINKKLKSIGKSKTDSIRKKAEADALKAVRDKNAADKKWHKEHDYYQSKKEQKRIKEAIKKEDARYAKEQYNNSVKGKIENSVRKLLKGKKKKTSKNLKKYKKIGKETAKQSVAGVNSIVKNSTKEMYGVAKGSVRRKVTKKKR